MICILKQIYTLREGSGNEHLFKMSRRSSRVTVGSAEVLEVIREETSAPSSINIDDKKESDRSEPKNCPCEGMI